MKAQRAWTGLWAAALALGLSLDWFLLGHGLVKLESANAAQLRYDALIRSGVLVAAGPAGAYGAALHDWAFQLLYLVSPRMEVSCAALNALYYAGIVGLFFGMRRRFGAAAGATASALLLACPVSAILSKHLIATALGPPLAVFYVLRHLDFAKTGEPAALGACAASLGALVALNYGHAWLVLPLLYEMRRLGRWRAPLWPTVLGLPALASAALAWFWWPGQAFGVWGGHYGGVFEFLRRALLVEWRMNGLLPNLDLIFVIAAWAGWTLWRRRRRAPAGLAGLLAYALPMALLNREATVFWQVPFCVLAGWAASEDGRLAGLALAYALLALVSYHWLFRRHFQEPNYFVLSSLRTRRRVLAVLSEDLGLRAGELARLSVSTRDTDGGIPALAPGLAYLAGALSPPLPPGGDRCFSVSDQPRPLPAGAKLDRSLRRDGLFFQSWRGGPPCPGNVVMPTPPVVGLDLRRLRIETVSFAG